MIFLARRTVSLVAAACAFAGLAGCSSSERTTTDPGSLYSTILINASATTAYVVLGAPATLATVSDPSTSTAWDLAFTAQPTVAVNGGASGPGGVRAYCLCTTSSMSLAQIEVLTSSAGEDAFGAVTSLNVPADSAFHADVASQAITGWYDYNVTTHAITTNTKAWGVRLASTSGAYAKLHVTTLPSPGESNAGPVTIEWAVQSSASGTLGADRQLVVDLTSGAKVYVNLSTGTTSASSSAAWDIALQGYTITVDGGVSGSGNVGAVPLVPSTFYNSYAAITAIPVGATGIPSSAFATDGAGGVFLSAAPYRYDPTSHQVYPTYDVYLIKRGTDVYKAQVTSYYSTTGVFGYVTLRYEKLSN
jgi:hypothetical protein